MIAIETDSYNQAFQPYNAHPAYAGSERKRTHSGQFPHKKACTRSPTGRFQEGIKEENLDDYQGSPLPRRPTDEWSLDHGPASAQRIGRWSTSEHFPTKLVGKFWEKQKLGGLVLCTGRGTCRVCVTAGDCTKPALPVTGDNYSI